MGQLQLPAFKDKRFQNADYKTKKQIADEYFDIVYGKQKRYTDLSPENQQKIKDSFADEQINFSISDKAEQLKGYVQDKNLGDIVFGKRDTKEEPTQEEPKTPEVDTQEQQPAGETISDQLYRNMIENPIAPNADGTMPPPLPVNDPLHQMPQTKEEAIQKSNEAKKYFKDYHQEQDLKNQDLPLEDDTLNLAFAGAGAGTAGIGVVKKALAKTAEKKLAADKLITAGQAFAKGDIVGNVAANGAMGVADASMSEDFKKDYPLTSGLIELGAGLAVGGFAGVKAENRVMQKYQTFADDVKAGKVSLDDAENALKNDSTFMTEWKKANDIQAEKKAEDDAYNALTPQEKEAQNQNAQEFLKTSKPEKIFEDGNVASHVDENGNVVLEPKKSEPVEEPVEEQPKKESELDQVENGWKELDMELHGEDGVIKDDMQPKGIKKELPLTQQLLNTQAEIRNSLRKAKFEESLDNVAGATAHKENADALTQKAKDLQEQIKLQEQQTTEPKTPEEPIVQKPRIGEPEPEAVVKQDEVPVEELLKHPRLNELLDMRKDVLAKDMKSPQKLVSKGAGRELDGHNGTDKMAYDKAQYERNYANDFELTKSDVAKIKAGNIDDKVSNKLEHDLGVMDNHPDYSPDKMSESDWEEANSLFSKGLDNVVVATYAGVDEDENGNISFDPAKFVLGLGGYTAVKTALKNKVVQGKLKEYAQDAINKIDMNPAIYKENGLNAMSPVKSNSQRNTRGAYNVLHNDKNSAEIGRGISDEKLLLEKGDHWYKNKEIYGYGLSKNIEKHVNGQKDLTLEDIVNTPKAMENSDNYINRGNLVFDFPNKEKPTFRVVFTKKLDENKNVVKDKNGNDIWTNASMFRKGKGGRLESLHNQLSKETGSQSGEFSALQSSSNETIIPQNEPTKISNVTFNGKNSTEVRKADSDILLSYAEGHQNQGDIHIQKHLSDGSVSEVKTEELLNTGDVIKNGTLHEDHGKNVYYLKKDGIKYRVTTESGKNDNEKVIKFNSTRNLEEKKGYEISLITDNSSSDKNIIPQTNENKNILHANAGHTLAGAFFGGADSEMNQRDYNGDGVHDFKDLIYGAGAGAIGINALKKVRPTWFEDGFVRGEKGTKIGVFAGDGVTVSNKAQKAFNKGELKEASALPDETKLQLVQRKMQDKFNRVKQLINHKASMESIDDVLNPYQAEELMHGKVESKLTDFETQTVTPIIEDIAKAKLTTEQVDEYLWARHAPERNKAMYELHKKLTSMNLEDIDATLLKYKDSGIDEAIKEAKKNDNSFFGKFSQKDVDAYQKAKSEKKIHNANEKLSKNGSGMSDEEAYKIINKYKDNKAMNDIAQKVYAMNRSRLELIRSEGLESDEFVKTLEGLYDNYVPLRREFGDTGKTSNIGKGFDINGHETKKAKGSNRKVESPLMHSILAYEDTIVRAGKNEVGKSFYKFAQEFPDENLYSIDDLKNKAVYTEDGGVVNGQTLNVKDDNVLHVKIDGKIKKITIHDPALASAFKNLNSEQINGLFKASHIAVRFMASVATMYNPEFVVSNFERDIQTAMINMPKNIQGNRLNILKDVGFAMNGIYKHSVKGKDNEWGKLFNELKHEGGTTGWHDIHSVQDLEKSTKAIINKYNGKILPKESAKRVLGYIDNVNDAVENSTRLVAYKMAKESGLSNAKAASIAKNLTVNFNRKGELGTTINSLYMFYNASVQGTTRMMMQLRDSRKAKVIVLGIAGSAFALDAYNRFVNAQEYALIPDYIKDTNFIFMNKDGSYETMQLPYGYNMFKAVGDIAAEAYHGEINLEDIPKRVLSMSVNAFSPIGVDSSSVLHTVLPSVIKPIYEVESNKNFFGGNIAPGDNPFAPEKPDSQNYYKSVNPIAKSIATNLNEATGGNMVQKGWIDISPETIEYTVGFATSGLGKFLMNGVTVGEQALNGEKVDKNKIPFARKFYHVPREKEETNLVYKLVKKSGANLLSPLERRRFKKWLEVAHDKKDLDDKQYYRLKKTFHDNQAMQDFAQKHNLQSAQEYKGNVQEDSYDKLTKGQVLRLLRERRKGE